MYDDLVPFFTYNDLYLKPIYKVIITVILPKLRQMGQSVSNWEIRERLKKMVKSIEVSDFKVLESSLEEVQFAAIVNNYLDCRKIIRSLNGVSFRLIGFTEPLTVTVTRGKLEFPTRVDWDKFFSDNTKTMCELNPGERPDTIYIGGLPFEWFKNSQSISYEEIFKDIFSVFGEVRHVDIPQCDVLRREMKSELSGIRLSVWSFGEDTFFEAYIQFKEYAGFKQAMEALSGKVLAQKLANGQLRETQLKVDFDRTAHLSIKKIEQRETQRNFFRSKTKAQNFLKDSIALASTTTTPLPLNSIKNLPSTSAVVSLLPPPMLPPTLGNLKSAKIVSSKSEINNQVNLRREKETQKQRMGKLVRRLTRAEKRRKETQKNREHELREKLKIKLTERLKCTKAEREIGAKALLLYIANLHLVKAAAQNSNKSLVPQETNDLLEYNTKNDFSNEEKLREELLKKKEIKLRNRIAERMLNKTL